MTVNLLAPGSTTLVTTASGACHLIDASGPHGAATVTRFAVGSGAPCDGFRIADLRRDGAPVRLAAVQHRVGSEFRDGVVIGQEMYLILEPLGENADLTLRRTTPVVAIEPIRDGREAPDA
jgi:hypothetical protein